MENDDYECEQDDENRLITQHEILFAIWGAGLKTLSLTAMAFLMSETRQYILNVKASFDSA